MSETLKPCPVLKHTDAGMRSLDVQTLCKTCPNRAAPAIPVLKCHKCKQEMTHTPICCNCGIIPILGNGQRAAPAIPASVVEEYKKFTYPTSVAIHWTLEQMGCDLRELEAAK